jgi:hypothetical protein
MYASPTGTGLRAEEFQLSFCNEMRIRRLIEIVAIDYFLKHRERASEEK